MNNQHITVTYCPRCVAAEALDYAKEAERIALGKVPLERPDLPATDVDSDAYTALYFAKTAKAKGEYVVELPGIADIDRRVADDAITIARNAIRIITRTIDKAREEENARTW